MSQITVTMTELEYTHGTSNKFYRVFVYGDTVVCQYGKIGTYGQWTPAKSENGLKVTASKIAKGYDVVRTETAYFETVTEAALYSMANGQATTVTAPAPVAVEPIPVPVAQFVQDAVAANPAPVAHKAPMPMLAYEADGPEAVVSMLADDAWWTQPKMDGDRVMIEVIDGEVKAWGRNGQPKVSNVGPAMLVPFKAFPSHFVFDGEVVGSTLHLFDLPYAEGIVNHKTPFSERFVALDLLITTLGVSNVVVVPVATDELEKGNMLAEAQANNREGVMFRKASAGYSVGRSYNLLKHKFVRTLDAVVTGVGTDGKNSALLSVYATGKQGGLLEVGKASTIGKGKIEVGQVVEVKYLYITDAAAPRLYQPRIVKVRYDKGAAECTSDQLIGAQTNKVW
jgi:ATP-dependent DNA ligase/predicted DNA-binding WGR domain protein